MEKKKSIFDARKISVDDVPYIVNELIDSCNQHISTTAVSVQSAAVEIEARLKGHVVNLECVKRLLNNKEIEWEKYSYKEKKVISKLNRKCTYRQRNNETICKSSILKVDLNSMWASIHVSTEIQIQSMSYIFEDIEEKNVTRYRGVIKDYYVEVAFDDNAIEPRVEVEVCDARKFDISCMKEVLLLVCKKLQGSPKFVDYYDWKTVQHITRTSFGPLCIDKGGYQKPRTMTTKDLLSIKNSLHKWAVTPKVDGLRRFLIVIDNRVFSASTTKDVQYEDELDCCGLSEDITILDCEYTSETYYIFDIAVDKGVYCGNEKLENRRELIEDVLKRYSKSNFFSLRTLNKPYVTIESFENLSLLYNEFLACYKMDGLIFVNKTKNYMNTVYKWKLSSTVDLEVSGTKLMTCDNHVIDIPWTYSLVYQNGVPVMLEGIWEFEFVAKENILKPIRYREDKVKANSKEIIENNIVKSVPGTLFSGVGCYLMRKYHNRVKREMINKAVTNNGKAVVVDIGTGQGGDFTKWEKAEMIYCIEPDKSAIEEMVRRHPSGKDNRKIRIINTALKNLDLNDITAPVDVFIAFFCMNLFSDDDWSILSNLIREKGSKKCKLLAIAITNPKEYNNDVFKVKMYSNDKYSIELMDTRISPRIESVVKIAELSDLFLSNNMVLVGKERLDREMFMTTKEIALSSMYTKFIYKKKKSRA